MDLWLIRHPPPLGAQGICYGRQDLAVAGEALDLAARRLRTLVPQEARWVTSPARRCLDLAHRLHPAPEVDSRLLERAFGEWEGKDWQAIDRSSLDDWAADPWDFAPPGGESARQVLDRAAALVAELAAGPARQVWVTHQGVIRAVAGRLLALPAETWMSLTLPFAGVFHLRNSGRGWRREESVDGQWMGPSR